MGTLLMFYFYFIFLPLLGFQRWVILQKPFRLFRYIIRLHGAEVILQMEIQSPTPISKDSRLPVLKCTLSYQ
ncbi:hypothetical protein LZ30DRAFT_60768 [Colletotrichum cereale]|nr:hypothetical protein LZ30DRAFT_60768 [Colletotrichum cereale]